jgi:ADP-heptose:LPS heptosyltransferase
MLFQFHKNLYPKPFVHQWALLEPLRAWDVSLSLPAVPLLQIPAVQHELAQEALPAEWMQKGFVALAPSASYALKRWPVPHWQELIRLNPDLRFVVLGGPEDKFVEDIVKVARDRVRQLAGKLNYLQSSDVVAMSQALVSNDTGLMHVAEQLGKPCVALLGPAPFGYPGRPTTLVQEINLPCRPCSKHGQGPCVNTEYQKCMVDLSPTRVSQALRKILP